MSMQDMEGYDELMQKLLDSLPPEQLAELVARLPPEVLEAAAKKRSS